MHYGSRHNWHICVAVHNSLIDHDQVGHKEGIKLFSGSVQQGGIDAYNSDVEWVEVPWSDREECHAKINFMREAMCTEVILEILVEDIWRPQGE